MLSIAQVTNPGLQAGGVVLVDDGAVGEDRGRAGEGGPFAGGVQEGDVDVPVGGEVVGLAGFGVGVEEEVDAAVLLFRQSVYGAQMWCHWWICGHTSAARAIHLLISMPDLLSRVVIMPNLHPLIKVTRSEIFVLKLRSSSLFFSL
jgi:hypothetical protein